MPDIWMDVDTALSEVPVNIFPLTDDTDFKSIEGAVAYNAAGMALRWHFVTCAGAYSVTSVTPTTGGNYDWTDQGDSGIYTIEIPASGGASINNDTEGFGWFTGVATGILPWRGPVIGFRRAALNDLFIEGGTASTNLEDFFDGTGYAGGTAKLDVNVATIANNAITAAAIATGAIDADAIADNAIDAGALAADCITSAKIADNAIAAEHIAAAAIDFATFAADCKTGTGLKANVESISADAITATAIQNDAITAAKIANGAIDAATFAADVDAEAATWIWNAATASYGGAGTYGQAVEDTLADTNELQADWANGGRLDLIVDAILEDTGTTLDGIVDSILEDTAAMPTAAAIADAVWDEASTGHTDAGKAGAQLWTDLDAVLADTDEIQAELADGGRTDLLIDGIKAKTDSLTFTVAGDVDCNVQTWKGAAAQDMTGDAFARLGAPAGASVSADVAAVKAETAAILTDTAVIGAAGAGLTALPWNAAWDAEVQSEVFDALDAAFTDATSLTANGLLSRIRILCWILRNKIEVTDANGNTVIYQDDSTTPAFSVSSMLTDDSTTTTRLRAA